MKGTFAVFAIILMIAAAFAGCIGGSNEPVVENREFSIIGTNSTGVVSGVLVLETIKETITAETRTDVAKRQRTAAPEFTFAINISNPDFVSACLWSFGDGQTGTGLEAKYAYANPGSYFVTANITFKDGLTGMANISAAVNYRAECQDSVSGVFCYGYDKIVGDEYWEYAFPVYAGAKKGLVKTTGDPADTAIIPSLGVSGNNDVALEVRAPDGTVLGSADSGDPGTDESVEFKKVKNPGNYIAIVGCFDAPVNHTYLNLGPVGYFLYIDIVYA